MALPFNPPNPYGSYFSFTSPYGGDPSPGMWRQPNYPAMAPVSSGVASALGSPSEGFNPTQQEFMNTRARDIAFQRFIDRTIKNDPRTTTVGNMLLDGVYGSDTQSKMMAMARIGGPDAYAGLVGTLMNTPGLSGYFGGAARSLAVGSLAASTSGLTMNGYGVFGDKSMNLLFADNLMRSVNQRFYGSNGNPILAMTNGLNRDQLGGVMVQAASQGAFTGLDMGKLEGAGRNMKFLANDTTLNKITDFMKSTTKALGSLIDVYGNISAGDLMQKAQQITGLDLSRLENAKLMSDRIQRLRDTARVTGVDTQSMFDMSARAGSYLNAIGMRPEVAGTFGVMAATQGMMAYRSRQLNTAGFYTNTISPMEAIQTVGRDLAGMSQDPIGARMAALEMALGAHGVSGVAAASIRAQAGAVSPNGAGLAQLDALGRSIGADLTGIIRGQYGGDVGRLLQQLSPGQQQNLGGMLTSNLRPRNNQMIRQLLLSGGLMSGSSTAQVNAMQSLFTNFDNPTIDQLLTGNAGDLASIIRRSGFNEDEVSGLMQSVSVARGMGGRGSYIHNVMRNAMAGNPFLSQYQSVSTLRRTAWMNAAPTDLPSDFRGSMLGGGFVAGMLDRYTGDDIVSKMHWMAQIDPLRVAGIHEVVPLNFQLLKDPATGLWDPTRTMAAGKAWRAALERSPEGRGVASAYHLALLDAKDPALRNATLTKFFNAMSQPDIFQSTMSWAKMAATNNGDSVAWLTQRDADDKSRYGDHALAYLALAQGEKGTFGASLKQKANILMSGLFYKYNAKTDDLGMTASAMASAAYRDQLNSDDALARDIMLKLAGGGKLDANTVSILGRTGAASLVASRLQDRVDTLGQLIGSAREKEQPEIDQLKRTIAQLRGTLGGGKQSMDQPGKMQLEGTLLVQETGNGLALKLDKVLGTMTGGKTSGN